MKIFRNRAKSSVHLFTLDYYLTSTEKYVIVHRYGKKTKQTKGDKCLNRISCKWMSGWTSNILVQHVEFKPSFSEAVGQQKLLPVCGPPAESDIKSKQETQSLDLLVSLQLTPPYCACILCNLILDVFSDTAHCSTGSYSRLTPGLHHRQALSFSPSPLNRNLI